MKTASVAMALSERRFLSWMRRKPRPTKLRAHVESGAPRVLPVRANSGGHYWKELLESLASLSPTMVEALNDEGDVLRAVPIIEEEEAEEEETEEEEAEEAAEEVRRSSTASEDRRLETFAKLLAQAYKDGAAANNEASEKAFTKLVDLTNVAFQRLDLMEKMYSRAFRTQMRAIDGEEPKGESVSLQDLLMTFLMSAQNGGKGLDLGAIMQAAAAAQKANGAAADTPEGEPS